MQLPEIDIDLAAAYAALQPLALFAVGITAYGVFVLHFYRFLARRDILDLDLSRYDKVTRPLFRKAVIVVFHVLKVLFLFPLFVFFWFLVMAGLLFLMGKNQSIDSVMLAAMGVVAAIRISAFYSTTLSTDIAKVLPLGLLSIILIDNPLLRTSDPIESIEQAALRLDTMIYYLCGVVALELLLRAASGILGLLKNRAARRKSARGCERAPSSR